MKTFLWQLWMITIILFVSPVITTGQSNCEEYPERIDSVHSLSWNTTLQDWELNIVQTYIYNQFDKVETFQSFDALTRVPLTRREYYYDNESKLIETLSFKWVNDGWQNVQNVFYTNAPDGTDRYETIYNWVNNAWYLQSRMINHYENNRRIGYTGQLVNRTTQEFYDYANYYISYTDFGKIDEWYGQKISDGSLLFNRIYFYNQKNNLYERHLYNPVGGDLQLTTKNFYSYDIHDLNNITINQKLVSESWENTEKFVYYRRIDNAKKVTVCLNGRSLCVAKQAIPGLLRAGATLGACPVTVPQTRGIAKEQADNKLNKDSSISFFPNPATESVNVFAGESYSRVELINSNGQTIRAFPLQNGDLTVIERNGLPSGIYFLRFVGQEEVKTEKLIFR